MLTYIVITLFHCLLSWHALSEAHATGNQTSHRHFFCHGCSFTWTPPLQDGRQTDYECVIDPLTVKTANKIPCVEPRSCTMTEVYTGDYKTLMSFSRGCEVWDTTGCLTESHRSTCWEHCPDEYCNSKRGDTHLNSKNPTGNSERAPQSCFTLFTLCTIIYFMHNIILY